MPTDRVITVGIQQPGDYNQAGQFVPGVEAEYRRWATLIDTSLERLIQQGGSRGEEDALYRVRYFRALAEADVRITFVTEADGDRYTVSGIEEVTGRDGNTRRRWLELTCIRADTE